RQMKKKIAIIILFLVLCSAFFIVFIPSDKGPHSAKHVKQIRAMSNAVKVSVDTEGDEELKNAIDTIISEEPDLDGSIIGMNIRSSDNGQVIYDHNGKTRMNPASNMKILTAVSALETLGEDYTFTTEILTDGQIDEKTLNGNLYIKGKGDPTLLPSDFESFAKKVKEEGIHTITGDVIGDDTWYDDERLSADIIWSDEDYYYASQISAL